MADWRGRTSVTADAARAAQWYQRQPRRGLDSLVSKRTTRISLQRRRQPLLDHNRRQNTLFRGKERLWQSPTITLDLEPGSPPAPAPTAGRIPCYNPKRDFAATAALVADHVMYQHYDTV